MGFWEWLVNDGRSEAPTISRRERNHMRAENDKRLQRAHLQRQMKKAQAIAAEREMDRRREQANARRAAQIRAREQAAARRAAYQRRTRDSATKRGWWFS